MAQKTTSRWSPRYAREQDALELTIEGRIDAHLASITEDKAKELLADLRARRDLLHIQPEFTPYVVGIAQQILAFGAAGIALAVATAPRLADLAPLWAKTLTILSLFYVDLMVSSLLVLAWFFVQARSRYPFLFLKRLGNAVPFFYYETLNRDRSWSPIPMSRGRYEANKDYLDDFERFAKYIVEESPRQRLRNELQQYYLLLVYQGYLDQYELQLVHLFLYTAAGGIVSLSLMTLLL